MGVRSWAVSFGQTSGVANSVSRLVPGVADGEGEEDVVAGVMVAEAGAREMAECAFKLECATLTREDVRADHALGREIYRGRVARRNIAAAENDAAGNTDIGRDFFRTGEIPLPDYGLETAAVHCAHGREHDV